MLKQERIKPALPTRYILSCLLFVAWLPYQSSYAHLLLTASLVQLDLYGKGYLDDPGLFRLGATLASYPSNINS